MSYQHASKYYLSALAYEFGGLRREIASINNASSYFSRAKLPFDLRLLESEYFHEADTDPLEMIAATLYKTLDKAHCAADEIDMVIISSANLEKLGSGRGFFSSLLQRFELEAAIPLGLSFQQCTTALSAINTARQYLADGMKNIAVASFDVANSDEERIQPFGVMSDAASSYIVSSTPSELEVAYYSNHFDLRGIQDEDSFDSRQQLISASIEQFQIQTGVALKDVDRVFSTNFYKPVSDYYCSLMGINKTRVDISSAREHGHCVCADPLINLTNYLSAEGASTAARYLLQSYAPGFIANLLLNVPDLSLTKG